MEAHLALQRSLTLSWRLEKAKNQQNSVFTRWHDASAMFYALNRAGLGAVLSRGVTYQPSGGKVGEYGGIAVNEILSVFGAKFAPPGGRRTSLSLETRKSAASLEELRDVLSLVKHNSAF